MVKGVDDPKLLWGIKKPHKFNKNSSEKCLQFSFFDSKCSQFCSCICTTYTCSSRIFCQVSREISSFPNQIWGKVEVKDLHVAKTGLWRLLEVVGREKEKKDQTSRQEYRIEPSSLSSKRTLLEFLSILWILLRKWYLESYFILVLWDAKLFIIQW